jgi:NADPH:quinone reductase
VFIDSSTLSADVRAMWPAGIDGVLDLLGNHTFQDSLGRVRRFGQVCIAGFLGGAEPVPFDTLSGFAPGATLSFFASFMYGTPEYPLDAIPLQQIVERVERGD